MHQEPTAQRRVRSIRLRRPNFKAWRATDAGQSLVEFSLVLPMLLILMFGIIDFGRAFYTWLTVTNAAREGARVGVTQANSTVINKRITDAMGPLGTADLTITLSGVNGARGSELTVDLVYDFQFVTPIGPLVALTGGSLSTPTISSHSSMRLE